MTLPASGSISISQIKAEMMSGSGSLATLINAAQLGGPDSMSRFRGFSNGPSLPSLNVAYVGGSPNIQITLASGGGATPQTYVVQSSSTADFASTHTVLNGVGPGTYTDNHAAIGSVSQTFYYRANASAQGKTTDWIVQQVTVPPLA